MSFMTKGAAAGEMRAAEDRSESGVEAGDPLQELEVQDKEAFHGPRKRYVLDDRGFDEVPKKYRRFYRKWDGPGDTLAPNEAICPVCKIVVRSARELRPGDRLYCMACMARMKVVVGNDGRLEAQVVY